MTDHIEAAIEQLEQAYQDTDDPEKAQRIQDAITDLTNLIIKESGPEYFVEA